MPDYYMYDGQTPALQYIDAIDRKSALTSELWTTRLIPRSELGLRESDKPSCDNQRSLQLRQQLHSRSWGLIGWWTMMVWKNISKDRVQHVQIQPTVQHRELYGERWV